MRRISVLVVVAAIIGVGVAVVDESVRTIGEAESHGDCVAVSNRPAREGSFVRFSGRISCSAYHAIYVEADLWRRTPGQSWSFQHDSTNGPVHTMSLTSSGRGAFLCQKDYKVVTTGWAAKPPNPANHFPQDLGNSSSKILFHTC